MKNDFKAVRDALGWHEYGSQDERRAKALPALDRIKAEVERLQKELEASYANVRAHALSNERLRAELREAKLVIKTTDKLNEGLRIEDKRLRARPRDYDEYRRLKQENDRLQKDNMDLTDACDEKDSEIERLREERNEEHARYLNMRTKRWAAETIIIRLKEKLNNVCRTCKEDIGESRSRP